MICIAVNLTAPLGDCQIKSHKYWFTVHAVLGSGTRASTSMECLTPPSRSNVVKQQEVNDLRVSVFTCGFAVWRFDSFRKMIRWIEKLVEYSARTYRRSYFSFLFPLFRNRFHCWVISQSLYKRFFVFLNLNRSAWQLIHVSILTLALCLCIACMVSCIRIRIANDKFYSVYIIKWIHISIIIN